MKKNPGIIKLKSTYWSYKGWDIEINKTKAGYFKAVATNYKTGNFFKLKGKDYKSVVKAVKMDINS